MKTSPFKLTQATASRDSDSDYCESGGEEEEGGARGAACVPEGLIKPIQRKVENLCEVAVIAFSSLCAGTMGL